MKIAHLVSTFPPYHGGMGNSVAGMAAALAHRGHSVVVLTPHERLPRHDEEPRDQLRNYSITPSRSLLRFGNAAFLPQLLWNLQGYDIVHLHYPFFGGAEVVAFWKQFVLYPKPVPLVVTYHMDALADGWKGKFFAWYNRHVMPWVLLRADRIVATTREYADHSLLRELPECAGRLVTVPHGIDIPHVHGSGRDVGDATILFVGALDRAHAFKGVDVLLRAFKFVIEFWGSDAPPTLVIVGDGDLRCVYEALADELGVTAHVRFVGYVSDGERDHAYAAASCVVLPSISASEAFGLVALEAMAAGKPVIASNLPGVRSVVVEGVTGMLVKPGDIVGLGKAMSDLLHDPERGAAMGRAGRDRAEHEYTWASVGEKLEAVYQSLTQKWKAVFYGKVKTAQNCSHHQPLSAIRAGGSGACRGINSSRITQPET